MRTLLQASAGRHALLPGNKARRMGAQQCWAALLFIGAVTAIAQVPPAAPPTAPPAATPAPPAATPPPPAATPDASPTPRLTVSEIVDTLSEADVNEALKALKTNYVHPDALSEPMIQRATLEGLVTRLGPGALLLESVEAAPEPPSPFRAEILDERIGYIRLGTICKEAVAELDAALNNFNAKTVAALILDLRATPATSDFDTAAEVARRFLPKGKMLFTVKKPGAKQERIATSNQDPLFSGLVVVVVDRDCAGAAEVIAALLRAQGNALVVGENTRGQAVEFADLPLRNGRLLRIAVAAVELADGTAIFPKGVKPDVPVALAPELRRQILARSLETGVSQFVFETERARMNEAALVAGTNPELDALEAEQRRTKQAAAPLRDMMLQRAVDLITTISVFRSKAQTP